MAGGFSGIQNKAILSGTDWKKRLASYYHFIHQKVLQAGCYLLRRPGASRILPYPLSCASVSYRQTMCIPGTCCARGRDCHDISYPDHLDTTPKLPFNSLQTAEPRANHRQAACSYAILAILAILAIIVIDLPLRHSYQTLCRQRRKVVRRPPLRPQAMTMPWKSIRPSLPILPQQHPATRPRPWTLLRRGRMIRCPCY